jgi:hypothetical protein
VATLNDPNVQGKMDSPVDLPIPMFLSTIIPMVIGMPKFGPKDVTQEIEPPFHKQLCRLLGSIHVLDN